jgi:hypothetical protein
MNNSSFTLTECECGVSVSFPSPGKSLLRRDEYLVYFDIESSLPVSPPSTISVFPTSYNIISDNNFIGKVGMKIGSVHRGETQTLLKMSVKDKYNVLLYTDYNRVVCAPQNIVERGDVTVVPGRSGPNGNSILSVETSSLDVGMMVTGPGIPPNTFILTIIGDSEIELSSSIITTYIPGTTAGSSEKYTFTRTTSCVDPATLKKREIQAQYIVLDKSNNWTYILNGKTALKFIRTDPTDQDISVILPAKNKLLFPAENNKVNIPDIAMIYAGGRVTRDNYPIN